MLRKATQKKLLEIVQGMQELHQNILQSDTAIYAELFQSCQEAAVAIGETIEREVGIEGLNEDLAAGRAVHLMEEYCEAIYEYSIKEEFSEEDCENLNHFAEKETELISKIESKYRIVFMPYKAAMWDSLESIWRAAANDPNCECKVMVLPYFYQNQGKKNWEFVYDGDKMPEYVPVTSYENYDLAAEMPDIAYVHNPYDDHNNVISVHPVFYAENLKKYVHTLVYVPYYVTSGFFSTGHRHLPVYDYADYFICQSQFFKDCCPEVPYHDRMLPLGSPKFDRIFYMMKQKNLIPEEWKARLNGKKSVMLNTSINMFLSNGDVCYKKLHYVFKLFSERKDVVLIWRPHPLLESTIKAMRPQFYDGYLKLMDEFQSLDCGILDLTTDVSRTVAIADAYIGEEASSIINLFMIAGKPVFYINNNFIEKVDERSKRSFCIESICKTESGDYYFTERNKIYSINIITGEAQFLAEVPFQHKYMPDYGRITEYKDDIYMSPSWGYRPVKYDIETGEIIMLSPRNNTLAMNCGKVIAWQNKVFFLPVEPYDYLHCQILEYNIDNGKWKQYLDPVYELSEHSLQHGGMTWDAVVIESNMYITASYTSRILEFHMEDGSFKLLKPIWNPEDERDIDENKKAPLGYSGIAVDQDGSLWLSETGCGAIVKFNLNKNTVRVYHMPFDFECWKSCDLQRIASRSMIRIGHYIIASPNYSNHIVRLDIESGDIIYLADDFLKGYDRAVNGYDPKNTGVTTGIIQVDANHFLIQRLSDLMIAVINANSGEYKEVDPYFSKEAMYKRLYDENGEEYSGFELTQIDRGYACMENGFFTLDSFLDKLRNGKLDSIKEEQLNSLMCMSENMNGTAGIHIHEKMLERYKSYM